MDDLQRACQAYRNDDDFADFTIICDETGRRFRVHRCFVAAHSEFFKTSFKAPFAEKDKKEVTLKEDLPEAVDCMIQYFYEFDYDLPFEDEKKKTQGTTTLFDGDESDSATKQDDSAVVIDFGDEIDIYGRQPTYEMQIHAWVYAVADKYMVPGLKKLALGKFKTAGFKNISSTPHLLAAASTIYTHIGPLGDDRHLRDSLLDMFILASARLFDTMQKTDRNVTGDRMEDLTYNVPAFAAEYMKRLMGGFATQQPDGKMWVFCEKCGKRLQVPCMTNGAPTANISSHQTNNRVSSVFKTTASTLCCGNTALIKHEVEVLSAVKISKFW